MRTTLLVCLAASVVMIEVNLLLPTQSLDIWRAAREVVKEHGDMAPVEFAQRQKECSTGPILGG